MTIIPAIFFITDTATTDICPLSLHDALPIYNLTLGGGGTYKGGGSLTVNDFHWNGGTLGDGGGTLTVTGTTRSEEHTSELQSRGHLVCRLRLEKRFGSGNLHALAPSSATSSFLIQNF